MGDWLKQWASPTGFLVILGGIIWGIQLNLAVLQHTQDIGKLYRLQQENTKVLQELVITQAETAIILRQITKDVDKHNRHTEK